MFDPDGRLVDYLDNNLEDKEVDDNDTTSADQIQEQARYKY